MSSAARLGRQMRRARLARGLSPESLAHEIHVPVAHIEAIEAGRWHDLPAGLYRRAELRAYCDGVGADAAECLRVLHEGPAAAPEVVPRKIPATARLPRPAFAIAGLAVLGIVALGWQPSVIEQLSTSATDLELPSAAAIATGGIASVLPEGDATATDAPVAAPHLTGRLLVPAKAAMDPEWSRRLAADGMLIIESTPPGARVTINGVGWGETPLRIRYLPFGAQRVRVAKSRYRSEERVVQLSAEAPVGRVRLQLEGRGGRTPVVRDTAEGAVLVVTSTPPGARVTINGIGWGETPVTARHLAPGPQRLRLVKGNYESAERVVALDPGRTRRVAVTLTPR